MLIVYILLGILLLFLFYGKPYYLQENLAQLTPSGNCSDILHDQLRMGNANARSASGTQYCVFDGQCKPTNSNYCGTSTLTGTPKTVYKSLADCMEETNPYKDLSPEECLSKDGRGTCSDTVGKITCYPGTSQGPNHEYIYARNLCYPSRQGCRNRWVYGYDQELWFSGS